MASVTGSALRPRYMLPIRKTEVSYSWHISLAAGRPSVESRRPAWGSGDHSTKVT